MKQIGARLEEALALPVKKFFMLLEIELNGLDDAGGTKTFFITSLPYSINFKNKTFKPDVGLTSFGPPRVSSTVDRELYEVILIDHTDEIQAQLRQSLTGKQLTVYAGFFDSEDEPILSEEDVLIAYQGVIDSGVVVNNYESKLVKLQAASPMANLDGVGGYIASKEGMDQVNPGDTCFDQLYTNQKAVTFRWGKK